MMHLYIEKYVMTFPENPVVNMEISVSAGQKERRLKKSE